MSAITITSYLARSHGYCAVCIYGTDLTEKTGVYPKNIHSHLTWGRLYSPCKLFDTTRPSAISSSTKIKHSILFHILKFQVRFNWFLQTRLNRIKKSIFIKYYSRRDTVSHVLVYQACHRCSYHSYSHEGSGKEERKGPHDDNCISRMVLFRNWYVLGWIQRRQREY